MKKNKSISTSTRRRIIKDFLPVYETVSLSVRKLKMTDYKLERVWDSKDENGNYHIFATDKVIPSTLYSIFACELTREECENWLYRSYPQLKMCTFKFYFHKGYVIAVI